MNVFILCTGRAGSLTFIRACQHIRNYSAAHESRAHLIGTERLRYPANHIEADNRMCWFLGRLDQTYGDQASYVHLQRDRTATARSYARRWSGGIMKAYHSAILQELSPETDVMAVCLDYVDTVNANIAAFLRDKSHTMLFQLEQAHEDFPRFWEFIGAQGDYAGALAEWDTAYNATTPADTTNRPIAHQPLLKRMVYKATHNRRVRKWLETIRES